jgi:polar amino acid transport system substrate-binding protein
VSITVIADEQGEPIRAAGVLMDITEQKNAQEKERQHQRQLLQSEKMAGLGLLISGIAHEINNPNNFISLSTPLLRQAWKSAQPHICHSVNLQGDGTIDGMDLAEFFDNVSTMIDSIDEGSDKITHIVGELKDYVRHDTADFATLDVNRVITAAMKLAGPMAKKLVRTIQLDLSQNPLYIRGNLQRLEQVVINLVQNACDAAQGGRGVVVVSSRRRDTRIEIAVEDNGVGIAPEHLSIIFEPFFTTKQHLGGTGLGLAVSQSIVQDHGATLSVQSTPGQGTLFTVVFEAVDNDG